MGVKCCHCQVGATQLFIAAVKKFPLDSMNPAHVLFRSWAVPVGYDLGMHNLAPAPPTVKHVFFPARHVYVYVVIACIVYFLSTGACARARFPHTSATSYVCRPSWGREPPWTLAYYTTSTRTSATPFWED